MIEFTENHVFGAKVVHFSVKKAPFHGNRNRRLLDSIPIPDFGIEYPVPGIDSGRPNRIVLGSKSAQFLALFTLGLVTLLPSQKYIQRFRYFRLLSDFHRL